MLERLTDELLNPPGSDPGVVVRLHGLQRTVLFDLGEHRLPVGELLSVTDLFVSHAHIDHFAGFDRLLRSLLGRTRTVRVYGGAGITERVAAKLHGYLWNLDFSELVTFEVHELRTTEPRSANGGVRRTCFSLRDRFVDGEALPDRPTPGGRLLDEPEFTVECGVVDHGTPCLAFRLEQRPRFRLDPQALAEAGLPTGPSLGELKRRIEGGAAAPHELQLGSWQPGRTVAYVTDCEFNPVTVRAALPLASGADVLYCEATFPDREANKAQDVHHLCGGQSGALARAAGASRLIPFHFSRRHAAEPSEILADVASGLAGTTRWSQMIEEWKRPGNAG